MADHLVGEVRRIACIRRPGGRMELKQFVTTLANAIWEREQRTHRSVDTAMLGYVQDAVTAELEYRRRMRELDRRIADLEDSVGAAAGH